MLPVGTQVVTLVEIPGEAAGPRHPRGAVGVVVKQPADPLHAYRVRFVDGHEAAVKGKSLVPLEVWKAGTVARASDADDMRRHVIYRCVVGSRAYRLEVGASDTDRRGIYLPPAERHWSLRPLPEQIEDDAAQECYWELGKFVRLALKANPNVLECLYTPLVELEAPLAAELRAMRGAFLSRLVYQTYNGYVLSQFKKLEQDRRTHGAPRWKHAMHLIRLLLAGERALRGEGIVLDVGEQRERLLAVRRGELAWEEVEAWRLRLHASLDAALAASPLPERPDEAAADAFVVRARRSMVA